MEARVSLSGTEREFSGEANPMVISLDLGSLHDGTQDFPISERTILNKPSGAEVTQVEPRSIKLRAYSLAEIELPVKIRLEKSLPPYLKLLGATADPPRVKVLAPQERKEDFLSIHTEPVNLDEITQSATVRVKLVLPDQVQLAGNAAMAVKVRIDVGDREKKTK
jgi:YbbR domain-containing protein